MKWLKVNTEPKALKAPVAIGESVKIPLSSKAANTVKAAGKKRPLTLSWHSYCSGGSTTTPSLTHWGHPTHSQLTKDTVVELTRCSHWSFTVAVWLFVIEKFLYQWWSTRASNAKMIATLMCVSALCLVVRVSVDLNCLLWVNHCFLSFIFPLFSGLLFLRTALADLSQDCYKKSHIQGTWVSVTWTWPDFDCPLAVPWKKSATWFHQKLALDTDLTHMVGYKQISYSHNFP